MRALGLFVIMRKSIIIIMLAPQYIFCSQPIPFRYLVMKTGVMEMEFVEMAMGIAMGGMAVQGYAMAKAVQKAKAV